MSAIVLQTTPIGSTRSFRMLYTLNKMILN